MQLSTLPNSIWRVRTSNSTTSYFTSRREARDYARTVDGDTTIERFRVSGTGEVVTR